MLRWRENKKVKQISNQFGLPQIFQNDEKKSWLTNINKTIFEVKE